MSECVHVTDLVTLKSCINLKGYWKWLFEWVKDRGHVFNVMCDSWLR